MKFIYLSRNFNRCGYYILEHLLNEGIFPVAVIIPEDPNTQLLDDPSFLRIELENYLSEVKRLNGKPLRFTKSLKLLSQSNGIPFLSLKSIKTVESMSILNQLSPDLIVLGGGWHELIPEKIISLPRLGVINTHPSILPEFRGRDVHRWQIAAGVRRSGVTIHYVDSHFDTGDILEQAVVNVGPKDNAHDLIENIARISGPILESVISRIRAQSPEKLKGKAQLAKDDGCRYFSRWKWESEDFLKVQWSCASSQLTSFIRACSQESFKYNGPHTICNGIKFIIRDAEITNLRDQCSHGSGVIVGAGSDGLLVTVGNGTVINLTLIQPATEKGWPEEVNSEPAYPAIKILEKFNIKIGDQFS